MTLHGPGRAAQRVSLSSWAPHPYSCLRTGLLQAAASGSLCFRNAFSVSAFFTTGGILFQSSGTRCEKFFLTSSLGAGIHRFSGSAAALATLSPSLAILNQVSLFTLSFPLRIRCTCCICIHIKFISVS
jgi:hypothetical protein